MLPNNLYSFFAFVAGAVMILIAFIQGIRTLAKSSREIREDKLKAKITIAKESILTASQVAEFCKRINETEKEIEGIKSDITVIKLSDKIKDEKLDIFLDNLTGFQERLHAFQNHFMKHLSDRASAFDDLLTNHKTKEIR